MLENITSCTKLFAIIGNPVKHSLSPSMYNYSFNKLGMDSVYLAFELENEQKVEAYIESMKLLGIKGGNVTMPFKASVMPFLDEISPEAQIIGAVNTLVNNSGIITGYNTDGEGLMLAIASKGVDISGKAITLFGAGGAANSILYAAAFKGATSVNIIIAESSPTEAINKTIAHLKTERPNCNISVSLFSESNFESKIQNSHIIINATPLGMHPNPDTTPIEESSVLTRDHVVVDIVYNPRVTKLLAAATETGCTTLNGLDMLLWQAVKAFELFTDGGVLPVENIKKHVFGE